MRDHEVVFLSKERTLFTLLDNSEVEMSVKNAIHASYVNQTTLAYIEEIALPVNVSRSLIMYVAFAVTFLTSALAVSAAVSMKASHSSTMVGLAFATSILMTLTVSIHLPASLAADDCT